MASPLFKGRNMHPESLSGSSENENNPSNSYYSGSEESDGDELMETSNASEKETNQIH